MVWWLFWTANVLLSRKNIKYEIFNELGERSLLDTGLDHFGAVVGENCAIGASVIILPGRQIPPGYSYTGRNNIWNKPRKQMIFMSIIPDSRSYYYCQVLPSFKTTSSDTSCLDDVTEPTQSDTTRRR